MLEEKCHVNGSVPLKTAFLNSQGLEKGPWACLLCCHGRCTLREQEEDTVLRPHPPHAQGAFLSGCAVNSTTSISGTPRAIRPLLDGDTTSRLRFSGAWHLECTSGTVSRQTGSVSDAGHVDRALAVPAANVSGHLAVRARGAWPGTERTVSALLELKL